MSEPPPRLSAANAERFFVIYQRVGDLLPDRTPATTASLAALVAFARGSAATRLTRNQAKFYESVCSNADADLDGYFARHDSDEKVAAEADAFGGCRAAAYAHLEAGNADVVEEARRRAEEELRRLNRGR